AASHSAGLRVPSAVSARQPAPAAAAETPLERPWRSSLSSDSTVRVHCWPTPDDSAMLATVEGDASANLPPPPSILRGRCTTRRTRRSGQRRRTRSGQRRRGELSPSPARATGSTSPPCEARAGSSSGQGRGRKRCLNVLADSRPYLGL